VREERKALGLNPSEPPPPSRPANGAPKEKPKGAQRTERPAGPSKNRVREQERLEGAVEQAEAALSALEDELADPRWWATKYESAKSTARHTAARRAVEDAYAALEAFEAKV